MGHPLTPIRRPKSVKRKRHAAPLAVFVCLVGLLALAGCAREKIVEVTGKATVDGKPLVSNASTVMFAPDKDNSVKTIPSASLDENGVYRADTADKGGVPTGWYKVYI